ncbi:MAG TPA: hypothetical protein VF809_01230 [Candidatus Saccharimonadales bacterium]
MTDRPRNSDYNWDGFNPDEYHRHNYVHSVLDEDQQLIRNMHRRNGELGIAARSLGKTINIAHGGNFYPDIIGQHLVSDNGIMVCGEYGAQNIKNIQDTLSGFRAGANGIWQQFEDHAAAISPEYHGSLERIGRLGSLAAMNIFTLRKAEYDAGYTFFGPESITADMDEWRNATTTFARSVRPGGLVTMAFMMGSEGYDTPGEFFPAVPIYCDDVAEVLDPWVDMLEVLPIDAERGARPINGPQYTGIGLATGISR